MTNKDYVQIENERREKLIKLDAGLLVNSLLELAQQYPGADDAVERLIATNEQNVLRFKNKLAALKRRKDFVEWKEMPAYELKLESMLDDLRAANIEPRAGVELMAMFYDHDVAMIENCDDSSGTISGIFSWQARDLFIHYAAQCADKEWVKDTILRLYEKDDYELRCSLFEKVTEYLPETVVRSVIDCLWRRATNANKEDNSDRGTIFTIQSIAKQLNDPTLLEKSWRAIEKDLPTKAIIEIAQACLDAGDAKRALSWLESINKVESYHAHDCDDLLFAIHSKLNNHKEMANTAWRMFRAHRGIDSLNRLILVIGEDQLPIVIGEETAIIHKAKDFDYSDAKFLIDSNKIEDAERYLLQRIHNLDGNMYSLLLEWADAFENNKRFLIASIIYRSLLDSILSRAHSKTYHHGAKYLKKLNGIAPAIEDWGNFISHNDYVNGIKRSHARKTSFWARYEETRLEI